MWRGQFHYKKAYGTIGFLMFLLEIKKAYLCCNDIKRLVMKLNCQIHAKCIFIFCHFVSKVNPQKSTPNNKVQLNADF